MTTNERKVTADVSRVVLTIILATILIALVGTVAAVGIPNTDSSANAISNSLTVTLTQEYINYAFSQDYDDNLDFPVNDLTFSPAIPFMNYQRSVIHESDKIRILISSSGNDELESLFNGCENLTVTLNDNALTHSYNEMVTDMSAHTYTGNYGHVTIMRMVQNNNDTYFLQVIVNGDEQGQSGQGQGDEQTVDPAWTAPVAVEGLVYTGSVLNLVTAGTAEGGTIMQYKVNDGEYSADLPTATAAGTYNVYYKVVGDSDNNDSAESNLTVTIKAKPITVTIANRTSVYGEAQVALTATTEDGAIANGDKNVYTLTCAVTNTSNAGAYDIIGTDTSDNYAVTFVGQEGAYTVEKRVIGINWTHINDFVYNGSAQKPTATAIDLINGDQVALTVSGEQTEAGTYVATAAFATEQANYALPEDSTVTFVIRAASIDKSIEEGENQQKTVEINSDDGFDPNSELVVRKVNTTEESYEKVVGYIGKNEVIATVYDVKVMVNGKAIDLAEHITVRMLIPEDMRNQDFKVLNVSDGNGSVVEYERDGDYVVIRTTTLDQFAFVYKENELNWSDLLSLVLAGIVFIFFIVVLVLKKKKPLPFAGLIASAAILVANVIIVAVLPGVVAACGFGWAAANVLLFILLYITKEEKVS